MDLLDGSSMKVRNCDTTSESPWKKSTFFDSFLSLCSKEGKRGVHGFSLGLEVDVVGDAGVVEQAVLKIPTHILPQQNLHQVSLVVNLRLENLLPFGL